MNSIQNLIQRYASCPTTKLECEINGKKYVIVRHFTGDKEVNQVIARLAQRRANREMGIADE